MVIYPGGAVMGKRGVGVRCLKCGLFFTLVFAMLLLFNVSSIYARQDFFLHCYEPYLIDKTCPQDICRIKKCTDEEKEQGCRESCQPKSCPEIPFDQCPQDYCNIMVNCAGDETCNFRMMGEAPACGNMAYEGQDVTCCEGFVRRCGVEFLDDTCDMVGENSMYNLPICVPCGDGHCSQFENACNCPEDCGEGEYQGFDYKEYLERKEEAESKKGWGWGKKKKVEEPEE